MKERFGTDNPDEIIFRIMKEPEARVTALLNNEIQIAQFIPPQLVPRVEKSANAHIVWEDAEATREHVRPLIAKAAADGARSTAHHLEQTGTAQIAGDQASAGGSPTWWFPCSSTRRPRCPG